MKQFLILAITLTIATLVVILCNPVPEKEVRIVNAQYEFKNQEITPAEVKTANVQQQQSVENKSVKMNNVAQNVVKQDMKIENKKTVQTPQKTAVKNVNTTKTVPVKPTPVKATPAKQPAAQVPVKNTIQTTQPAAKQEVKPAPVVPPQAKPEPVQTAEQKKAQEAISWNKWRANVHNQIISQVNLPTVPTGTVFTYSFTVTKDGTISNVKTSSVSPQYTAYAIQYIAPVVRRSAHAGFLKFPAGTERTVVDVKYSFKTTNAGYGSQANANNFNDVEIIKK